MQVFVVESLYCRENATKKVSFRRLVILIYSLFLFVRQKGTSYSLIICSFHLTSFLLACSLLCFKIPQREQPSLL